MTAVRHKYNAFLFLVHQMHLTLTGSAYLPSQAPQITCTTVPLYNSLPSTTTALFLLLSLTNSLSIKAEGN